MLIKDKLFTEMV